jgi:ligand-binding sensor domain-containing protein
MQRPLLLLLILVFGVFKAQAQVPKDTAEYDPSNDIISSGIIDKAGNLWFAATGRGVYRYTNNSFTHLTMQDGLCGNNVSCIYEDKSGMLWFGTDGGVCKYDGKTFSAFALPGNDSSSKFNYLKNERSVGSILQDKKGNYWFLTLYNGVYKYDGKTFSNFLSDEVLMCLLEDNGGKIWAGSWRQGGVYRFNGKNFSPVNGTSDNMIFCLYKDKKGNVWIGTRDHGADKFDGKKFVHYSDKQGLCNTNVSCIFQDSSGKMWFGSDISWGATRGDACRYDGNRFENITAHEDLTSKDGRIYSVRTIVQDWDGNLWFGSRGGLLLRYDGKVFTDFSTPIASEK